jgi:hypothetical protein
MTRAAGRLVLVAVVGAGPGGCSTKPPPRTEDPDTTNLRRIYQAFRTCEDFKNRGPLDVGELKRWLGELGEPGTPDEFLISRRDGQPFVICYGQSIDPKHGDIILAHEKDGADGKRYVLTLGGSVKPFTDAEFAKARFAAAVAKK